MAAATYVVRSGVGEKQCSKCKQSLPADTSHFHKQTRRVALVATCKTYHYKQTLAYSKTAAGKANHNKYHSKYRHTEAGKAAAKRGNAKEYLKPASRALLAVRNRMNATIKKALAFKTGSFTAAVCASSMELLDHLRGQYTGDMTDNNRGTLWEIDHILPISAFNMNCAIEQAAANHYTNLQPLLTRENRQKGAKYCRLLKEAYLAWYKVAVWPTLSK